MWQTNDKHKILVHAKRVSNEVYYKMVGQSNQARKQLNEENDNLNCRMVEEAPYYEMFRTVVQYNECLKTSLRWQKRIDAFQGLLDWLTSVLFLQQEHETTLAQTQALFQFCDKLNNASISWTDWAMGNDPMISIRHNLDHLDEPLEDIVDTQMVLLSRVLDNSHLRVRFHASEETFEALVKTYWTSAEETQLETLSKRTVAQWSNAIAQSQASFATL